MTNDRLDHIDKRLDSIDEFLFKLEEDLDEIIDSMTWRMDYQTQLISSMIDSLKILGIPAALIDKQKACATDHADDERAARFLKDSDKDLDLV